MRLAAGVLLTLWCMAAACCLKFVPNPWCWIWLFLACELLFFVRWGGNRIRESLKLICINLIPILFFFAAVEYFFFRLDNRIEIKQDSAVVCSDELLGSVPIAGSHSRFRIRYRGEEVAAGTITIGPLGNRITPAATSAAENSIVFYGCSFTFGLGLSDAETLPWQFAQATGRPIFNLALNGYGPQQFLALLETKEFSRRVPQMPDLVIYLALPCHLERLNGEPAYCASSPRYLLRNGEISRAGTFLPFDGVPILGILVRQSFKSSVFSRIYSLLRHISIDDHERIALFRAAVLQMRALLQQKIPEARFVVLAYNSPTNIIAQSLEGTGICVINCSELLGKPLDDPTYHIPYDNHPTGTLWREMVPALIERLDIKPDKTAL